ncbi:MAG: hypothetical protein F6K19_43455 [Cyanothece sp. SIO1E1]|nr:hypothetical protein [Cyanothece sp. SIO1E1]
MKVALADVEKKDISAELKAIECAGICAEYDHVDQGIESLKKLVEDGSKSPKVFMALGDLYDLAESDVLATEAYGKAVMLASGSEDITDRELLAIAKNALGRRLLEQSRTEYEVLEAGAEQGELRERLKIAFGPSAQVLCGTCVPPIGGMGRATWAFNLPFCAQCFFG